MVNKSPKEDGAINIVVMAHQIYSQTRMLANHHAKFVIGLVILL